MLKYLFAAVMLLAPLAVTPAEGADYQNALAKATERKPVVLFCYGANYDKVSEQKYELFVKKRKIMKYARGAIFLAVPVYQLPNEKEKREYKKVMGDGNLPGGIWSYPCLAVVDGQGNLRGVVQSADEMKDPETAGAALELLLDSYTEQEKLLKKARSASGKRQINALAEAADMPGIRMPSNPLGQGGDTGLGSLATNATGMLEVGQKMQTMSLSEAAKYMRSVIADGYYSRRQRQEILAAYSGHVRRNGGSAARLRAIYNEMRNIDPTSIYGAYAEGAIKLWVEPREAKGEGEYAPPSAASSGKTALGDTKPGSDKKE